MKLKARKNRMPTTSSTLQFHLTGFKPLPLSLKAQLSLLVCIKVLSIAVAKLRLHPWSPIHWECRMPVIVCQGTQKSKAESALRRIGRTPLLQSSSICRTGAVQWTKILQKPGSKDVTTVTKIGFGVLQKSMTKLWKQPFFQLCCAPHKLLLCCLSTEHSRETRQLSTGQDIDGWWQVCGCLEALLAPENVFAHLLVTTLGNSYWHQLHSIALLHQIASASMTKRSPLQIFQNHAVSTVPFVSLHYWRKAPPWSCIWPHRMAFGVLLTSKVSRRLV